MIKKRMDNPESREHYRYQRIVNRWAFAVISLLICGFCVMVTESWWGLLVYPAFLVASLTAIVVFMGFAVIVSSMVRAIKEFYQGY